MYQIAFFNFNINSGTHPAAPHNLHLRSQHQNSTNMKISCMLASVACAAVLLASNVMSSPIGPLHKRATNKVIVG
jgi:hypothetical protein